MSGGRKREACVSQTVDEPLGPGSTAQRGARGGHSPTPSSCPEDPGEEVRWAKIQKEG